jgi:cytoskeletal protein CcmA (bactofilin family)
MLEFIKKKGPAINTIIGEKTNIVGNLQLEGDIIIYGKIKGDIITDGTVTIFSAAEIKGNIEAAHLNIGGHVEGNINCQGRVALGDKAFLRGDIKATQIVIEDGAVFEGRCEMHFPPPHATIKAETQSNQDQVEP